MKLFKSLFNKSLFSIKGFLRRNKKVIRVLFFTFFTASLFLLLAPQLKIFNNAVKSLEITSKSNSNLNLPSHSFAYIEVYTKQVLNICLDDNSCERSVDEGVMGTSSGFFYSHEGDLSIVTAGHSCTIDQGYIVFLTTLGIIETFSYEIRATDFQGNTSIYVIDKLDLEKDMCLLKSENNDNQKMVAKTLKISKEDPAPGDIAYNIAAPMSIFLPESLLLQFSGYYSGVNEYGDAVYTIPAAPGSSGSPVLNEKNEITGMIHSTLRGFHNVSLSPTIVDLRNFLDEN